MSDNGLTWRHVDRTDRQLEDSGQSILQRVLVLLPTFKAQDDKQDEGGKGIVVFVVC